jgi:hypothetical protein
MGKVPGVRGRTQNWGQESYRVFGIGPLFWDFTLDYNYRCKILLNLKEKAYNCSLGQSTLLLLRLCDLWMFYVHDNLR